MRLIYLIVALTAAPTISGQAAEFPTRRPPVQANISVCFVPSAEDCEAEIAEAIDGAKTGIKVQAYGFTSIRILDALVRAVRRGAAVDVILDKSNDEKRYTGARLMTLAGAKVWIDDRVTIAHNKLIIIDGREVIGGSFNYTNAAATHNAENVTFVDSPVVAARFTANWEARKAVSRVYVLNPAPGAASPPPRGLLLPAPRTPPSGGVTRFATEPEAKELCPADIVVWVNLQSKVFHFAGNRYYGHTAQGAYMCEADAKTEGDRVAANEVQPVKPSP